MSSDRLRRLTNRVGLSGIHVAALAAFIPGMFHWSVLVVLAVVLYATGGLGITLCFHRTLTHRSLRLRKPVEYFFAILGTLALQGDPIRWVATHRKHHAHADDEGDPHGIDRGFSWAHMRWLYRKNDAMPTDAELRRYAADLYADPFYRALTILHAPLQVVFGLLLFVIGGWPFVIWGVFVRLVVSYHSTWFVNSASHSFGYRTYKTPDRSTNCWWVALITQGEGWHNNHHAFPFSARHGLRWFEFDLTWLMVKFLALLRLADRIKVPTMNHLRRLSSDNSQTA